MSDPYTHQAANRLGGSLGGRVRVVSPVHRIRPARFVYPEAGPVSPPCPVLLGSVTPPSFGGGTTRWSFGLDPRGSTFWLAGDNGSGSFVEEYDLATLTFLQRLTLAHAGADFFGGDGSGGVVYMDGSDIIRHDSGGTETTLLSPTTVLASLDPTRSRIVNIARITFSTPFQIEITAATMASSASTLATITMAQALNSLGSIAVTPDGAVWWEEGAFGSYHISRWSAADGYRHGLASSGAEILPRPNNSVWASIGGVMTEIAPDLSTSVASCDVSEFHFGSGNVGQTSGASLLAWRGGRVSGAYPVYQWGPF